MEFLSEIGLFAAQILILVVGILALVAGVTVLRSRSKEGPGGYLEINDLTQKYLSDQGALEQMLLDKRALKKKRKQDKKKEKAAHKNKDEADKPLSPPRLFVLDFEGDLRASGVHRLGKEISAVLSQAQPEDEVLLRLESQGGMVHAYGLAAAHLLRIRDKGIRLTIAVDKVAASGGYLMACLADRLVAAPFAIIGSIGVVAQIPNINRLLKKNAIDVEMHTAGEFKRTLTLLGSNTERGRKKFKEDLEKTHSLFKAFVAKTRPSVDIEKVATGEIWYGSEAVDKNLIDAVQTSEAFLCENLSTRHAVYQVRWIEKHSLARKLALGVENTLASTLLRLWDTMASRRFPG
ncbi:MAG: protease SohB [Kistimonas sp.]|nr:protease SohB [Kistimonas sp.]